MFMCLDALFNTMSGTYPNAYTTNHLFNVSSISLYSFIDKLHMSIGAPLFGVLMCLAYGAARLGKRLGYKVWVYYCAADLHATRCTSMHDRPRGPWSEPLNDSIVCMPGRVHYNSNHIIASILDLPLRKRTYDMVLLLYESYQFSKVVISILPP
jgi:hypothetical protein